MNSFENELLEIAFQNYKKTGSSKSTYQFKTSDMWLHQGEALASLINEGYVTTEDPFDLDETDLFEITKPIIYELSQKGLDYVNLHLNQ